MARIKLNLPKRFDFSTHLRIRISDINYGGHLGNDAVLALIHEARLRYLKQWNFSETNMGGVGLIMTDSVIVYKSEAFHGEMIKVEVAASDFNQYGCDFFYRLTSQDTEKEIARAKTGIVFYDYAKRKMVKAPGKVQAALSTTDDSP